MKIVPSYPPAAKVCLLKVLHVRNLCSEHYHHVCAGCKYVVLHSEAFLSKEVRCLENQNLFLCVIKIKSLPLELLKAHHI